MPRRRCWITYHKRIIKIGIGFYAGFGYATSMIFRILFLGYAMLSTACTSFVMAGGQTGGVHEQHDGRTMEQVSKDTDITKRVQSLLLDPDRFYVHTMNGVVTLQGKVSSSSEVQQIINQVYRVEGVRQVDSQLVVRAPQN